MMEFEDILCQGHNGLKPCKFKSCYLYNELYGSFNKTFFFMPTTLTKYNIIPVKTYKNITKEKHLIYLENKHKPGIYCWHNINNNKIYIGSASDLRYRLYNYLSISYLKRYTLNYNSLIYKAILKYGYNEFHLHILKYCEINELIKWEQYYLNILKPKYNILKKARSSLGFKHSDETRLKFIKYKYLIHSHTTIILNKKDQCIEKYSSIRDAATRLGTNYDRLISYIRQGKLYKDNYIIIRFINLSKFSFDFEQIKNNKDLIKKSLNKEIKNKTKRFLIEVFDINKQKKENFSSIRKAAKFVNMHHAYITKCLNNKNYYKNKNFYISKKSL